jgi:hypothetical protein
MLRVARGEAIPCDAHSERPRATHKSLASLTAFRVIAGVAEHGRTIIVGVLVERDPDRHTGKQPRQAILALAERQGPEVFAIELQQIERIEDRVRGLAPAVECIEDGNAIGAGDRVVLDLVRQCPPPHRSIPNEIEPALDWYECQAGERFCCEGLEVLFAVVVKFAECVFGALRRKQRRGLLEGDPAPFTAWEGPD